MSLEPHAENTSSFDEAEWTSDKCMLTGTAGDSNCPG